MYVLDIDDYARVIPIFRSVTNSKPIVFSVIDGNIDGTIYVDDLADPKTALIVLYDMLFLNGDFNERICSEICDLLTDEVFPSMNEEYADFYCMTNDLQEIMQRLLSAKIQGKPTRKTFIFSRELHEQFAKHLDIPIPDGYEMRDIDQSFIEKYKYDGEFWRPETKRFGVALVNGSEVISECSAVFVGGGQAEISVETRDEYRKRGYATAVCAAFIKRCTSMNLLPNWGCWDFRTASVSLAKRLGFIENPDIMVFGLKIK